MLKKIKLKNPEKIARDCYKQLCDYIHFSIVTNDEIFYVGSACSDYTSDNYYSNFKNPNSKISTDKIQLLLTIPKNLAGEKLEETSARIIDFVNQISADLEIEKSEIFAVEEMPEHLLIVGPRDWMFGIIMISLFFKSIRVSLVHEVGRNYQETISDIVAGKLALFHSADRIFINCISDVLNLFKKFGWQNFFRADLLENFRNNNHKHSSHSSGVIGFYNCLFGSKKTQGQYFSVKSIIDNYPIRREWIKKMNEIEGKQLFDLDKIPSFDINIKPAVKTVILTARPVRTAKLKLQPANFEDDKGEDFDPEILW